MSVSYQEQMRIIHEWENYKKEVSEGGFEYQLYDEAFSLEKDGELINKFCTVESAEKYMRGFWRGYYLSQKTRA